MYTHNSHMGLDSIRMLDVKWMLTAGFGLY